MTATQPLKILNGVSGRVELYPNKVIIKGKAGNRIIYTNQIAAVQIKNGSFLRNGYIRFTLSEDAESLDHLDTIQGENAVTFTRKYNTLAEEIKEAIEEDIIDDVYGFQWSAILDEETCNYCRSMDGKVIPAADKKFHEYQPGRVHQDCRCIWVAIMREETHPPAITGIPKQLKPQTEVPPEEFKDLASPLTGSSKETEGERLYPEDIRKEQEILYGRHVFDGMKSPRIDKERGKK